MSARWTIEEFNAYQARQQAPALPRGETLAWEAQGVEGAVDESEKGFMGRVIALAKMQGWLVYHTYRSDRSEAGFPDLVLANGQSGIFAEVKTNTGKLTMAQQQWLSLLTQAGHEVYVWRPKDWVAIEARLSAKTHLP